MTEEYWSLGSRDEAEGLTAIVRVLDDNGEILCGYANPEGFYKSKRITKQEYHEIKESTEKRGFFGVVSEIGYQKYLDQMADNIKSVEQSISEKVKKSIKVVKKLRELGLAEDKDDMVRELQVRLPELPAFRIVEMIEKIEGDGDE